MRTVTAAGRTPGHTCGSRRPGLSRAAAGVPTSAIRDLLSISTADGIVSLAGGIPDDGLLPVTEVRQALARAAVTRGGLSYGPTQGIDTLRAWIAEHELGGADPDLVVVTHGAQQALSLLVEALVDPGTPVVVERASYVGMLQPLHRAGAAVHPAPGDADGPLVADLAHALGAGLGPALLYTVPTFQNPTGAVLGVARRRQLGRLAATHGVVVVDDDPYRRLGVGPPPPRLRDFVPADLAVTVGSFSKCVAPGLRVGWLHGPRWLVDAVVRLKQSADLHTTTVGQLALVDVLAMDGWLDEHAGRLARVLLQRSQVLVDELHTRLGPLIEVEVPAGGMFTWASFADEVGDTDELARAAIAEGVAFVPGSAFEPLGRPLQGARLGFASLDNEQLREAARRLARAVLRQVRGGVAPSSSTPRG